MSKVIFIKTTTTGTSVSEKFDVIVIPEKYKAKLRLLFTQTNVLPESHGTQYQDSFLMLWKELE